MENFVGERVQVSQISLGMFWVSIALFAYFTTAVQSVLKTSASKQALRQRSMSGSGSHRQKGFSIVSKAVRLGSYGGEPLSTVLPA